MSCRRENLRGFLNRYICIEFHTRTTPCLRYHEAMRFLPKLGYCRRPSHTCEAIAAMEDSSGSRDQQLAGADGEPSMAEESHLLKTIGWVSAALGAVALGLIVGREIRQRYKFNRRTPYDLYAHSGDELPDVDYSVGI
jgi:hypothetical protein